MEFIKNGGAILQKMIDEAAAGSRHVTVTGNYEIEQTVRIPS